MTATLKRNGNGYGYKYTDLAEVHRYLEQAGFRYFQEIETVDGEDYVITHCLDESGKTLRKCRGCRVVKTSGKNPAQDYGAALTYARRYSLLMAYGLATADDDAASLNPARPKAAKPKATEPPTNAAFSCDRQAGMDAVKQMLDAGKLELVEIQNEVRKHGYQKMQDMPNEALSACVRTLTMRAEQSA